MAPACGSASAHLVSLAHSTCALFPLLLVCNILIYNDGTSHPRATFCLSLISIRPTGKMNIELQRRLHRTTLDNEVEGALNSLARSRQAQAASRPATLAQSCSLKAVAEAVALAGPPLEGLDGPGALSELRVARSYTNTPIHNAVAPRFSAEGP